MKVSIVSVSRSAWAAAFRACRVPPGGMQLQRAFTSRQPFHIIRQQHGQFVFRHRHNAAFRAVDHRDG